MQDLRASALTDKELIQHADLALLQGKSLPVEWQKELVYRLDRKVSDVGFTHSFNDKRQLSLF